MARSWLELIGTQRLPLTAVDLLIFCNCLRAAVRRDPIRRAGRSVRTADPVGEHLVLAGTERGREWPQNRGTTRAGTPIQVVGAAGRAALPWPADLHRQISIRDHQLVSVGWHHLQHG